MKKVYSTIQIQIILLILIVFYTSAVPQPLM